MKRKSNNDKEIWIGSIKIGEEIFNQTFNSSDRNCKLLYLAHSEELNTDAILQ